LKKVLLSEAVLNGECYHSYIAWERGKWEREERFEAELFSLCDGCSVRKETRMLEVVKIGL
jgi:hypothetical protein